MKVPQKESQLYEQLLKRNSYNLTAIRQYQRAIEKRYQKTIPLLTTRHQHHRSTDLKPHNISLELAQQQTTDSSLKDLHSLHNFKQKEQKRSAESVGKSNKNTSYEYIHPKKTMGRTSLQMKTPLHPKILMFQMLKVEKTFYLRKKNILTTSLPALHFERVLNHQFTVFNLKEDSHQ